jgi:hypothetical protein
MGLQHSECFDGATTSTDTHDAVKRTAGYATWFSEFSPTVQCPKKHYRLFVKVFHLMGLCCAIVGRFATYVGLLESHPDLITIYLAYHPEMSPHIPILLQIQPTTVFFLDNLEFWFMAYSRTGDNVFYTGRCGVEVVALRIAYVNSLRPCGLRSNLDLIHFLWTNFSYYCTNYTMVILPSQTSGDRILYTLHYKAEMGERIIGPLKRCFWDIEDPRWSYDFSCQKPNRCTCTLYCKQPISLKTAATKIVWAF